MERVESARFRALSRIRGRGWRSPHTNPLGVEWFGLVMGLGFVLSFGYWCTDFLVVQRAMAADSMSAARRTPLIAAFPKMVFPFLVILPGLIAIALPICAASATDPWSMAVQWTGAVQSRRAEFARRQGTDSGES